MATLCGIHLHAGAASFQPVEDGLRPVYERIVSIEAQVKALENTRYGLDPQAEERLAAEEKMKALQTEKNRLTEIILKSRKFAESPLVMF
jgi:hypothetical protein